LRGAHAPSGVCRAAERQVAPLPFENPVGRSGGGAFRLHRGPARRTSDRL